MSGLKQSVKISSVHFQNYNCADLISNSFVETYTTNVLVPEKHKKI